MVVVQTIDGKNVKLRHDWLGMLLHIVDWRRRICMQQFFTGGRSDALLLNNQKRPTAYAMPVYFRVINEVLWKPLLR